MLSSAGDFMFVSLGHTDPAGELFLPCPSHPQGHFTALRLRGTFFSAVSFAALDAIGNSLGYGMVLVIVSFFKELDCFPQYISDMLKDLAGAIIDSYPEYNNNKSTL